MEGKRQVPLDCPAVNARCGGLNLSELKELLVPPPPAGDGKSKIIQ